MILIHQIITHGMPLFIRDTAIHDMFVATYWSRYIDQRDWTSKYDADLLIPILEKR